MASVLGFYGMYVSLCVSSVLFCFILFLYRLFNCFLYLGLLSKECVCMWKDMQLGRWVHGKNLEELRKEKNNHQKILYEAYCSKKKKSSLWECLCVLFGLMIDVGLSAWCYLWSGGPGVYESRLRNHEQVFLLSLCFSNCHQDPAVRSCPDFLQKWTTT